MDITEVRVRLVDGGAERLRAFCSVTFDGDFVIRDLKVIEGANGHFVAMPSRKLAFRCGRCGCKNHLRARFCNECGSKLADRAAPRDANGRSKLHVDVAHPINTACRERIQKAVIEAFEAELEKAKQPGYKPAPLDDAEEFEGSEYDDLVAELKESAARRHEQRSSSGGQRYEPDAGPDEEPVAPVSAEQPAPRRDDRPPRDGRAPRDGRRGDGRGRGEVSRGESRGSGGESRGQRGGHREGESTSPPGPPPTPPPVIPPARRDEPPPDPADDFAAGLL